MMQTEWQSGLLAFQQGRLREAADRLQAAADDNEQTIMLPVRHQTLTYLGAVLYALGQPERAITAFEQARQLVPASSPDSSYNLANAYLAVGRLGKARRELEETLRLMPGHVEAAMLLQRLDRRPAESPVHGTALGESPEGVKEYLRTLTFSTVTTDGYDPGQVRHALGQIEHYLDFLIAQIAERDQALAQNEREIERYRQMEDKLIENIIKAQQQETSV